MRALSIAVILLAPLASFADDRIDTAIRKLSSEDAAVRDAAEKTLLGDGEKALEPCRKALGEAKDPEAKVRLKTIVELLEAEGRLKDLPEIWKDEWFRLEYAGAYADPKGKRKAGWAHFAAEPAMRDGVKAWKIVVEYELPDSNGKESMFEHYDGVVAEDSTLTPTELMVHAGNRRGDVMDTEGTSKMTCDRSTLKLEVVTSSARLQDRDKVQSLPVENPDNLPLVLPWLVPAAMERASIARTGSLAMTMIPIYGYSIPIKIEFAEETTMKDGDKDVPVRHYSGNDPERGEKAKWEFWVNDKRGLLKACFMSMEITRSEKAAVVIPSKPSANRAALRAVHDAFWAGLCRRDWKACEAVIPGKQLEEIFQRAGGIRDWIVKHGAESLKAVSERFGMKPEDIAGMSDREFAAWHTFGAPPLEKPADVVVLSRTVDVDRGEVEFVLPDGHYREISYAWDGDNWSFKYAGLLQTGTNEICKTPKEALAKWKEYSSGFAFGLIGIGTEKPVTAWLRATAPELETARETGATALAKLAEDMNMGIPELNRTGARAWTILVFRKYLGELSKSGKLQEYGKLEWDEPRIEGRIAHCKCTKGPGAGQDWVLHDDGDGRWLVETDPFLEGFQKSRKK